MRDLTGNAFNPLFCNSFHPYHLLFIIKRGFEIIGESLRMVINIEYTIVSNIEPVLYCSSWYHEPWDKRTLSLPVEKEGYNKRILNAHGSQY